MVNNNSVQVAEAKVLLLRDNRSIEGLFGLFNGNPGPTKCVVDNLSSHNDESYLDCVQHVGF